MLVFLEISYQGKDDILIISGNTRSMLKVNILPMSRRWSSTPRRGGNANFLRSFCETLKYRLKYRLFKGNTIGRISDFPSIWLPANNVVSVFVVSVFNIKARVQRVKEQEIYIKSSFSSVNQSYNLVTDRCLYAMAVSLAGKYYTENGMLQNTEFLLSLLACLSLTMTAVESQLWKVKTSVAGEHYIWFTQHLLIPLLAPWFPSQSPHPTLVPSLWLSGTKASLIQPRTEQASQAWDRVCSSHWLPGPWQMA